MSETTDSLTRLLIKQRAVQWHDGKQWQQGHELDATTSSGRSLVISFGDVYSVARELLSDIETRRD